MPFTPFHMGPGLAFKGVLGRRMSIVVFGWSQIVIDVQPGIALLRNDLIIHGWTHTLLGAFPIGILAGLSFYFGNTLFQRWSPTRALLQKLGLTDCSWRVVWTSSFVGTYSHILLDSLMHLDMRPWYPYVKTQPLLALMSDPQVYWLCVWMGVLGALLLLVKRIGKKRQDPNTP